MSRPGHDRGQAVVELALVLPLVCALLMGIVQVGLVVRHQLAVQVAARAAARAASVSDDAATAAVDGARGAIRLRPLSVEVTLSTLRADHKHAEDESAARRREPARSTPAAGRLAVVAATVRYVDPTDVPLVGLFVPPIELRATVTMAVEPP